MDSSNPDTQNIPCDFINMEEELKTLEFHLDELSRGIDDRNISLEKANQKYFNTLKENDEIKSKLIDIQKNNVTCQSNLLDLRNLIANPTQDNKDSIINKIDFLISILEPKIIHQQSHKDNLLELVELESKVLKYQNELSSLEIKNKILNKIIQSKNGYINVLLKFVTESREKHVALESSLKNESRIQNELIDSLNIELSQIKSQNQNYEIKLKQSTNELNQLTEQFNENNENYKYLQKKYEESTQNYELEKEKFHSEINKLQNLFEKSKSDILEKYLEQFYPNITMINQMFDKKLSVCELYSEFLETQNMNKNLSIEKSVIEERLQTLTNDLDDMKNSMCEYLEEIQRLRRLEDKVLKLENENKELTISLKFYQNSAHSLYNGAKVFHDNFINLSDKIKLLVKHETSQINEEDSTGIMALKYIMELQNKFQEFNRLQTEFERQKLDFINEKQNIMESENKIDLLNQMISIFEDEKRQINSRYEVLDNEYQMLKSIFNNFKSKSEADISKSKNTIDELNKEIHSLQNINVELESKLKESMNQIENMCLEKDDLQNKLQISEKQNEFSNERLAVQVELVSQLEKSLENFRKQNENLMNSKERLETNLRLMEERNREYSNKIVKIDSKLSAHKFEIDLFKQKEKYLLERVESAEKVSNKNSELDFILDLLTKNKCSIDENLIKILEQLQREKETLNKFHEEKEKQWNEEKSILMGKVVQLENDLKNEINLNSELESQFLKLSSTLNGLNKESGENESMNGEQLKSQFSELSKRNGELTKELNELKHKILTSGQEYLSLFQTKNQLEVQLSVLNEEKVKTSSELNLSNSLYETKIHQLEEKFKKDFQELQDNYEHQNVQLQNKNLTCDLYEKKIDSLNSTVDELKSKLNKEKQEYERLSSITQSYDMMKHEMDILTKQYSEEKQTCEQLRKQVNEYQNRYIASEKFQIEREIQFNANLNKMHLDYDQLQKEHNSLLRSNENLNGMIRELWATINQLNEKSQNNQLTTNEHSLQSTLNNVLGNLTMENKLLMEKYKVFGTKEQRLNSEIQALKSTIMNLEECLQNEKENANNMKELFQIEQKSPDLSMELSYSFQQLSTQNNELVKKCDCLQSTIERLKQDLDDQIKNNKQKVTEINDAAIETLKVQLQTRKVTIEQLNEKLNVLEDEFSKTRQEYSELSTKFQQQTAKLDSLNKELSSNSSLTEKYIKELNDYKSMDSKSKEEITNMKNKIESLQNEISSLQNTNQQLKILARKYKSQCDEYQKQRQQQNLKTSNEAIEQQETTKELESKVQNLSSENERLKEQIDRLNQENEKLRAQTEETEQKAKSITQQVKQKFSNLKRVITDRDNEIGFLRSLISKPENNSGVIPGKLGKMPVSSTIVSASSQQPSTSFFETSSSSLFSSNIIQPSSSSNEDNDRLQSAQISSHTTSMDESSLESFFQNQVTASSNTSSTSNNKRRFIHEHQRSPNQDLIKRKRENERSSSSSGSDKNINQNLIKQTNEDLSDDVSETTADHMVGETDENANLVTIDDVSNVIIPNEEENRIDQSHQQEQTESNDGNASSTDSSSQQHHHHLDRINFASNSSSQSTLILGDVSLQPSTSSSDNNRISIPVSMHNNPPPILIITQSDNNENFPIPGPSSGHRSGTILNVDRLLNIIPQAELLSSPNLMTPNLVEPSCIDEEDGIVPTTPVLYTSSLRFGNSSPQVPQSGFVFSHNNPNSSSMTTDNTPTTPTFSETVSSLISVDEFDSNIPRQQDDSNQEESISSTPSSSDSTNQETQSGNIHRSRKLKIHGSAFRDGGRGHS